LKDVKRSAALLAILAVAAVAVVAGALGRNASAHDGMTHDGMQMSMQTVTGSKAEGLRVSLNRLLGEHALLATQATDAGYSGSKSFPRSRSSSIRTRSQSRRRSRRSTAPPPAGSS
jgi:hypothetical protein